jgi:hypothetical protein
MIFPCVEGQNALVPESSAGVGLVAPDGVESNEEPDTVGHRTSARPQDDRERGTSQEEHRRTRRIVFNHHTPAYPYSKLDIIGAPYARTTRGVAPAHA